MLLKCSRTNSNFQGYYNTGCTDDLKAVFEKYPWDCHLKSLTHTGNKELLRCSKTAKKNWHENIENILTRTECPDNAP